MGIHGTEEATASFSQYDIVCSTPRRNDWFQLPETGFYSKLNVTRDTIDFSVGVVEKEWSQPVDFQFYRQPVIQYITPRHGPQSGDTTVTFYGLYFYDTGTITCSFGDIRGIPGTYDNYTETITCVSPNQTVTGNLPVEIALN
eukprot:SAG11_NODE_21339_length_427_cov_0.911585_1_plen_142_part_11